MVVVETRGQTEKSLGVRFAGMYGLRIGAIITGEGENTKHLTSHHSYCHLGGAKQCLKPSRNRHESLMAWSQV